jgi:anti-sigma-K factor RskA
MNLVDHPELADRMAAAYGLGTLRGGARRRFEAQARQSPALRAAALAWQERFAAMTELQPGQAPSPNVWRRIEIDLANQQSPDAAAQPPRPWERALRLWRSAALVGGLATVAVFGATVYLAVQVAQREAQLAQADSARESLARQNAQLQAQPAIQYVAVLADDRSVPSLLVTFDPVHSTLTLKRLGTFQEGADKSLQLWALTTAGAPRSLGVVGGEPVVRLAAAESQVRQIPALAVSLEPKGGVAGDSGPTGPVLFKGALVQTP